MYSYFSSLTLFYFSPSFSFYYRLTNLRSTWTTAITVYNTVLRGIAVGAIRATERDNTDFINANELASRHSPRSFVWLKVIKVFGARPAFLHTYVHARVLSYWQMIVAYQPTFSRVTRIPVYPRKFNSRVRHSLDRRSMTNNDERFIGREIQSEKEDSYNLHITDTM